MTENECEADRESGERHWSQSYQVQRHSIRNQSGGFGKLERIVEVRVGHEDDVGHEMSLQNETFQPVTLGMP